MIDAHVHVWARSERNAAWLDRGPAATNRDFTRDDLLAQLDRQAAEAAIVVQSQDLVEETRELLELAEREPRVAGVVGYLPLHDPERLAGLDDLLDHDALIGARSLHALTAEHPLTPAHPLPPAHPLTAAVTESLTVLAERGLALDVVARPPAALAVALAAAAAHPRLHVIVDHLANRHLERPAQPSALPQQLSDLPNLFVKLSGLAAADDAEFAAQARAFLEAIGARRLMFGSDWPICLRHGDADAPLRRSRAALDARDALDADARAWVFAKTARRAYPRLDRRNQRENGNQHG